MFTVWNLEQVFHKCVEHQTQVQRPYMRNKCNGLIKMIERRFVDRIHTRSYRTVQQMCEEQSTLQ